MLAGIDPAPAGQDVAATVTRLLVDLLPEPAGTPPRYLRIR